MAWGNKVREKEKENKTVRDNAFTDHEGSATGSTCGEEGFNCTDYHIYTQLSVVMQLCNQLLGRHVSTCFSNSWVYSDDVVTWFNYLADSTIWILPLKKPWNSRLSGDTITSPVWYEAVHGEHHVCLENVFLIGEADLMAVVCGLLLWISIGVIP